MAQLPPKPPPFKRGRQGMPVVSPQALNALRNLTLRQVRSGEDSQVSYYGDRVVIRSAHENPTLPALHHYMAQGVVLYQDYDYLTCAVFTQPTGVPDPTTGKNTQWVPQKYDDKLEQGSQTIFYVAKPYHLQKTPWDGKSVIFQNINTQFTYSYAGFSSRNAQTNKGTTDQQVVYPDYFPGDIIQFVNMVTGLTDPNGDYVVWMDLNIAARQWITLCPPKS